MGWVLALLISGVALSAAEPMSVQVESPARGAVIAGTVSTAASADLLSEQEWNQGAGRTVPATGLRGGEIASQGLVSIAISLVLVLALVVALGWLVRRIGVKRLIPQRGRHLEVLDTLPLAFKRQVSLVRVGDLVVLVGIGEHELSCLATLPAATVIERESAASTPAASPPETTAAPVATAAVSQPVDAVPAGLPSAGSFAAILAGRMPGRRS